MYESNQEGMQKVMMIVPRAEQSFSDSGFILGGDKAKIDEWPVNPDGEQLKLIFSVDCSLFSKLGLELNFPEKGNIYVFSTYSKNDYFLDLITYSGDSSEYELILSGYTRVIYSECENELECPVDSIPRLEMDLVESSVAVDEYSLASFISNSAPLGMMGTSTLGSEYKFFCQLYSSDFPEPYKDVFYLTDALGYLFVSKEIEDPKRAGVFFVQTA